MNQYGWNETQERLVNFYKNIVYPEMNNEQFFPKFVDADNNRKGEGGAKSTYFKFGAKNWLGIPNPACRRQTDIPSFPHFSLRYENEKTGKILIWVEVSGLKTIASFLSMNFSEEDEFIKIVSNLPDEYDIVIEEKIKEYNFAQRPTYKEVFRIKANKIGKPELVKIIQKLEEILKLRDSAKSRGTGVFPLLQIIHPYGVDPESASKVLSNLSEVFGFLTKKRVQEYKKPKIIEKEIITKIIKCPSCNSNIRSVVMLNRTAKCVYCKHVFSITEGQIDSD